MVALCGARGAQLLGFKEKNVIADDISWYYANNYVGAGLKDKQARARAPQPRAVTHRTPIHVC